MSTDIVNKSDMITTVRHSVIFICLDYTLSKVDLDLIKMLYSASTECSKIPSVDPTPYKTSAPIGAWKGNFPPFQEIMSDRPTEWPTGRRDHREFTKIFSCLPIMKMVWHLQFICFKYKWWFEAFCQYHNLIYCRLQSFIADKINEQHNVFSCSACRNI